MTGASGDTVNELRKRGLNETLIFSWCERRGLRKDGDEKR